MTLTQCDNGAFGTARRIIVNAGSMHQRKARIVGSKASIEGWDERPNQLRDEVQGAPSRVLGRGMPYLAPEARPDERVGAGLAETLCEARSNRYYRFAAAMEATDARDAARLASLRYPDIEAGVAGARGVENCGRSADAGGVRIDCQ